MCSIIVYEKTNSNKIFNLCAGDHITNTEIIYFYFTIALFEVFQFDLNKNKPVKVIIVRVQFIK